MTEELTLKILREIAEPGSGHLFSRREAARSAADLIEQQAAKIAALESAAKSAVPKLSVWYGSVLESNGKTNWTAILHRGDIASGMTIDRSEYPDRVRYEADRVRWLIGEFDVEPFILDYDADKHSGYTAPATDLENGGGRDSWQPIETAPDKGEFLVYMPEGEPQIQTGVYHPNIKVIGNHFLFDMWKPTHWMPLPDAPKEQP